MMFLWGEPKAKSTTTTALVVFLFLCRSQQRRGCHTDYGKMSKLAASQRRKRALADAIAGVAASLVSLWTFYPIEVWKTNLQAGSCVARKSMFQGCGAKTLHTASSSFCYFFLYSWIFASWKRRSSDAKPHPATRLILSAVAAMLNTFLTLPLDVVSSKQVTRKEEKGTDRVKPISSRMDDIWQSLESHRDVDESLEFQECVTGESSEDGTGESSMQDPPLIAELEVDDGDSWKDLWKGLTPALLLCTNPSINYSVFDIVKSQVLTRDHRRSTQLTMPEAFVVGLVSKFVATIATYPLIRAKVILMVTSEKSLVGSMIRSYNKEGVRGLYKGCHWQLLHTVLKSALMMMVREKIAVTIRQLIVGNATT